MNMYVKIGDELYPATVEGKVNRNWDGRMTKAITLEMDWAKAHELFVDGVEWFIIQRNEINEYKWDNSEYCLAGDITDHRDGTITAVMGKLTDLEAAYEILLGGYDV